MSKKSSSKRKVWVRANQATYAAFVDVWNRSTTRAEAIKASGLSAGQATRWSTRLRKLGVNLKKFHKTGATIDVDALNKVARRALKA